MITFQTSKRNTPKFQYFIWIGCQYLSITFHVLEIPDFKTLLLATFMSERGHWKQTRLC